MTPTPAETTWLIDIVMAVLGVAILVALVRLVRGPSLPDRVVAFDIITMVSVAFTAAYAMRTGQSLYLDVAIILALITFMATVAFARYVERDRNRGRQQG